MKSGVWLDGTLWKAPNFLLTNQNTSKCEVSRVRVLCAGTQVIHFFASCKWDLLSACAAL